MWKKYLTIPVMALLMSGCGTAAPSASASPLPATSGSAVITTTTAPTTTATSTVSASPSASMLPIAVLSVATTSVAPKVCNGKPGQVICISKPRFMLYALFNGRIVMMTKKIPAVGKARHGGPASDGSGPWFTRESTNFHIFWKALNPLSKEYHVHMPYFMAFSGGQGIHYSAEYAGGYKYSHGCVGLKSMALAKFLYYWAPIGTRVIVTNS